MAAYFGDILVLYVTADVTSEVFFTLSPEMPKSLIHFTTPKLWIFPYVLIPQFYFNFYSFDDIWYIGLFS